MSAANISNAAVYTNKVCYIVFCAPAKMGRRGAVTQTEKNVTPPLFSRLQNINFALISPEGDR